MSFLESCTQEESKNDDEVAASALLTLASTVQLCENDARIKDNIKQDIHDGYIPNSNRTKRYLLKFINGTVQLNIVIE